MWGIFPFIQPKSKYLSSLVDVVNVRNVFMGLDKIKKKACGFCFVEYYNRAHAENAMWFLNGTFLDDRIICTDWGLSFREGRQYDRGQPGGRPGKRGVW